MLWKKKYKNKITIMCTSAKDRAEMEVKKLAPLNLDNIKGMHFFDPHIHMVSRTTDDYQAMADAGIVAVIEPAFWLGQPRTGVDSFRDYYNSLVGWERFRASQFGIKHYCTIGLNSREANNEKLAEQVMEILPLFIRLLPKKNIIAYNWILLKKRSFLCRFTLLTAIKKEEPSAAWTLLLSMAWILIRLLWIIIMRRQ